MLSCILYSDSLIWIGVGFYIFIKVTGFILVDVDFDYVEMEEKPRIEIETTGLSPSVQKPVGLMPKNSCSQCSRWALDWLLCLTSENCLTTCHNPRRNINLRVILPRNKKSRFHKKPRAHSYFRDSHKSPFYACTKLLLMILTFNLCNCNSCFIF